MQTVLQLAFSFLFLFSLSSATDGHNITRILAKNPQFSTFNHYLTLTHLAGEINRRQTITVCAVDNAAMSSLISKGLSLVSIRNVLSLHVFADYFGSKKLHTVTKGSTSTATMFQATGEAPGTTGYVHISDVKGGKVRFTPEDNPSQTDVVFVKSISEIPYTISVIQISQILQSPEAEAPTAAPDLKLTSLLQQEGCKAFYNLLSTSGAIGTFLSAVDGGVTVFCPGDDAVAAFAPEYKNLTASEKTSLLLYHGIPIYNSMGMLRSSKGVINTLATEKGAKKYDLTVQNDGVDVKLKTKVVTAAITGTVIDQEPVALYKINKVLLPRELFKGEENGGDAAGPVSEDEYGDGDAAELKANAVRKLDAQAVMAMCMAFALFVFV